MIEPVREFMKAAGQENTPEQVGKQIGYGLEEAAEGVFLVAPYDASSIDYFAEGFKRGIHTQEIANLSYENKLKLLDSFLDDAWVAIGGAIAMGADVEGAYAEIVRSNMSKIDPATGKMLKDANGKVIKPPGYSPPNLAPYLAK